MQPLHRISALHRARDEEHGPGRTIDNWRPNDSDVAPIIQVAGEHFGIYQRLPGSVEVPEPERRTERIGIEGIDAVIYRCRVDHIVRPTGILQSGNIENPGVNLV